MSLFTADSGRLISALIALLSVLPSHANCGSGGCYCPVGYEGVSKKNRQYVYAGWQGEQLNVCEFNNWRLMGKYNDSDAIRCGTTIISMKYASGYIGILPSNGSNFIMFTQDYGDSPLTQRDDNYFNPNTNKNIRTTKKTLYYRNNFTPKVFLFQTITKDETNCTASPKF